MCFTLRNTKNREISLDESTFPSSWLFWRACTDSTPCVHHTTARMEGEGALMTHFIFRLNMHFIFPLFPSFLLIFRRSTFNSLPFILGDSTVKAIFYLKLHVFLFFFFYTIFRFFFVLKNEIL